MYVYNNIANEADINACSDFYVEQHNSILNAVISIIKLNHTKINISSPA